MAYHVGLDKKVRLTPPPSIQVLLTGRDRDAAVLERWTLRCQRQDLSASTTSSSSGSIARRSSYAENRAQEVPAVYKRMVSAAGNASLELGCFVRVPSDPSSADLSLPGHPAPLPVHAAADSPRSAPAQGLQGAPARPSAPRRSPFPPSRRLTSQHASASPLLDASPLLPPQASPSAGAELSVRIAPASTPQRAGFPDGAAAAFDFHPLPTALGALHTSVTYLSQARARPRKAAGCGPRPTRERSLPHAPLRALRARGAHKRQGERRAGAVAPPLGSRAARAPAAARDPRGPVPDGAQLCDHPLVR